MGCETSRPADADNAQSSLRRNKKKPDKIIGAVASNIAITENVKKEDEKISSKDAGKIAKIIHPHFFFSGFSETEKSEIIEKMVVYSCPKDEYIFKQNDPGSLFFIIKKGKVSIEINDKFIKNMDKAECFGELSLLYTAPRSASVKTETDCLFWTLNQSTFRSYTEEQVKKNYKIAKPFLLKVPLFQFLSSNQINSIAYATNALRYQPNDTVFKQGDDANAFYIVVEGEVKIIIENKDPIVLQKGESFGENSFKKNEVRSGSAVVGTMGAKLLSIGREGLLNCLGDNIEELIEFNILKWALKRSKIFENIPNEFVKKIIQISEIRECENEEIICKSKEPLRHFIICLEGKVENHNAGVLINEEYILEATNPDREILINSNIKKYGKGNIYLVPIKKIEALLGLNLILSTRTNEDIFKEYNVESSLKTSKKERHYKKNQKVSLDELIFERKIGEGQFGKVFLVSKKNENEKYALKCIKKKSIIEQGLERLIRNEKEIMEITYHPLIVRLEQTLKDEAFVYFLMQYIEGVDFFDMLREIGLCSPEASSFYLASLILCIQELHQHNIVYRDIKPENAVVDTKGYLYMIDLGTAKKLTEDKGNRTFTIIGTPHYMAPEIMEGKGYGLEVDIWSLGVMLYEMVCGKLPFGEDYDDPYLIYKEIMNGKITYPNYYYNSRGKQLIERLLQKNSRKREIDDFSVIKRDPFFEGFKWDELEKKTIKPPVVPKKKIESTENKLTEVSVLKYLEKEIKHDSVKLTTTWDEDF